jgi:hypothetical protein
MRLRTSCRVDDLGEAGDHQKDAEEDHDLPGGDFRVADGQDSNEDRNHAHGEE